MVYQLYQQNRRATPTIDSHQTLCVIATYIETQYSLLQDYRDNIDNLVHITEIRGCKDYLMEMKNEMRYADERSFKNGWPVAPLRFRNKKKIFIKRRLLS